MIQDIYPHTFDNQYRNEKPDRDSYALFFDGRNICLSKTGGTISLPRFCNIDILAKECIYLFSIDGQKYFLIRSFDMIPAGYEWEDISIFRTLEPSYLGFAIVTAWNLYNWYASHVYCGCCASPLKHSEKERMMFCETCDTIHYPQISPAVIVGVINGDKILLSKYANREYTRYALLAGFAEAGETIEETVKREVFEETGLKVNKLHYYKSQPWGYTGALLFGFFAELEGSDRIILDKEELALAEWFCREEIPATENNVSLTNEMIEYFRNGTFSLSKRAETKFILAMPLREPTVTGEERT